MGFGSLFSDLSYMCFEKAVPQLEHEVLKAGGTVPLYVPGHTMFASVFVAAFAYMWYAYTYYLRRYHVRGIQKASKMKKAFDAISTYRTHTSTMTIFSDVRTTTFPLLMCVTFVSMVWLTWAIIALKREWPMVWVPIQTFCQPKWQAFFWLPILFVPAQMILWFVAGAGWMKPWNVKMIQHIIVAEQHRLASKETRSGTPGDLISIWWFNMRWTYYAHGGIIGLISYIMLVWIFHDICALLIRGVDTFDPKLAQQELSTKVSDAWGAWKQLAKHTK